MLLASPFANEFIHAFGFAFANEFFLAFGFAFCK
jgi:hypothetical protein